MLYFIPKLAAHCFEKLRNFDQKFIRNPPEISITLSEHDRTKELDCDENGLNEDSCHNIINMTAASVKIHEKYRKSINEPSHYNDIALIKLKWPISFDDRTNIRPVCLPVEDNVKNLDLVDKTITVTGFGKRFFI